MLNIFDLDGNGDKLAGHYDVILIDGSHLLHRAMGAFAGLGFLEGEEWIPTGALYGFVSMSVKCFERWAEPSGCEVIFCWEGGAAERRKIYEDYKGNRRVIPDDPDEQLKKELYKKEYFSQKNALEHLIKISGMKCCKIMGWEADDALGTLAKHFSNKDPDARIAIYSGDGDMHQCVTEKVHVIAGGSGRKRDKVFDIKEVEAKWGVPPELIPALKGLAGDSGDNIPGVSGCGAGWAAKILTEYGSCKGAVTAAKKDILTGVYKGKKWKGKSLTPKIASAEEQIYLSEDLATIRVNLPFEIKRDEPNKSEVEKFLRYYQIKSVTAGKIIMLGDDGN